MGFAPSGTESALSLADKVIVIIYSIPFLLFPTLSLVIVYRKWKKKKTPKLLYILTILSLIIFIWYLLFYGVVYWCIFESLFGFEWLCVVYY